VQRTSSLWYVLAAAVIAVPRVGLTQEEKPPQLIQEPFIGALSFTQERGEIQISSAMRADGAAANRTAGVPLEIEYGITNDLQVSIGTGGFNYERPAGWSSPRDFGVELRYGRFGLLPNLHASVTLEGESESQPGNRSVSTMSGLQLGLDIPPLRMTHIFTSVAAGLWNSEGTETDVDWLAGVVVPFGSFRATIERPLIVSEATNRATVPGLIWRGPNSLDFGVATTLYTQPRFRATGLMLTIVLEF
jgi:hypothetical protein